jgi:hypothetical protein
MLINKYIKNFFYNILNRKFFNFIKITLTLDSGFCQCIFKGAFLDNR